MKILAIETSCDETAIAIVEVKKLKNKSVFKILANNLNSQIDLHTKYGGVFPMMAKREHQKNLPILLGKSLKQAKLEIKKIDLIAVTVGPGLEPALWTGITFAQDLAKKYKKKLVPINHMEGHIFSIFPKKGKTFEIKKDEKIFPAISLLISGGHTELVLIKKWQNYKIIGQTRDDAVGEAFDKVARMLGLPYPGGPEISRLANKERDSVALGGLGSATARAQGIFQQKNIRASQSHMSSDILFPRPMIHSKDYDFSFSGLKTAVLYYLRDHKIKEEDKPKIAKEFEDAVIEVLISKTLKAIKEYKVKTLIIGGGVSANKQLQKEIKKNIKNIKIYFPSNSLTGDNALMVAIAGYFNPKAKFPLKADGNLKL